MLMTHAEIKEHIRCATGMIRSMADKIPEHERRIAQLKRELAEERAHLKTCHEVHDYFVSYRKQLTAIDKHDYNAFREAFANTNCK